jgi:hypothetical protein
LCYATDVTNLNSVQDKTDDTNFYVLPPPPPIFLPPLETPLFQAILVKKMFMCGATTQLLPPRRTWLPKRVVVGRNQTLSLCKAGFSDSARPGVLHQRSDATPLCTDVRSLAYIWLEWTVALVVELGRTLRSVLSSIGAGGDSEVLYSDWSV